MIIRKLVMGVLDQACDVRVFERSLQLDAEVAVLVRVREDGKDTGPRLCSSNLLSVDATTEK